MEERVASIPADQAFLLEYDISVESVLKGSRTPRLNSSSVRVVGNTKQSRFYGADMEVYQNEENTVVVVPEDRSIFIQRTQKEQYKSLALGKLEFIQDTLFDMAKVLKCEETQLTKSGPKFLRIDLGFNTENQRLVPVERISFFINQQTNLVGQVFVKYTDGNPISIMKVAFTTIDFNHSAQELSTDPLDMVLSDRNKPLAKYETFEIQDIRPKK